MRVAQFGEGVFLRGFVDWMFHRLNHEADTDIRVTLIDPLDSDRVAQLMEQGGRYTVVQEGLVDGEARSQQYLIDCLDSGLSSFKNPEQFVQLARDRDVRVVVSNTTEAGIAWSDEDAQRGGARHEVRSYPGKLTWLLAERYASQPDADPLFVLPCELIADNGQELRRLVIRMTQAWDLGDAFETWLESSVIFYDTLVDRIVPGTPQDRSFKVADGQPDAFPVQVEWFHSWYLRGPKDVLDVLPLEALDFNVSFVDDLRPYRDLKVRVLNGLHTCMAPAGVASGVQSVAEAVDHPVIGEWLRHMLKQEIVPTLDLPAAEIDAFVSATWDRFRNPYIHHRLESLLLNFSAKARARLFDTVRDGYAQGWSSDLIAVGIASWLHLSKTAELADGAATVKRLTDLWGQHANNELAVEDLARQALTNPEVLGGVEWPESFMDAVARSLAGINSSGVINFLQKS